MDYVIHTIDASNVDRYGFFCYKSKPQSAGFKHKREWLDTTLYEGLHIKIIYEDDRSAGFVEYAPGEACWRAVKASGYMIIHCIWVVGSGKGKGYGTRLLDQVISDAQSRGMYGVAVVTSSSTWLAGNGFFLQQGFEVVDHAPPAFELLVKRFQKGTPPSFPNDWEERLSRHPHGLVVYHSKQCPYLDMFVCSLNNAAVKMRLPIQIVEFKTSLEARALSPSAYGVFGVVYNGKLLSYRPIGGTTLKQMLGDPGIGEA